MILSNLEKALRFEESGAVAVPLKRYATQVKVESAQPRIGLALSGGGFRASIFHLGVIRRLEELGIMPHVEVISAVSGGSIIAAYYVCRMESELRTLPPAERLDPKIRVRKFEKIAEKFFEALDHNLRTRAFVYAPFFHPLQFVKSALFKTVRATATAELIQREYDVWFYHGDTLDGLPSVTSDPAPQPLRGVPGPRVLLNATSLLSGERVTFSRVPVSGMNEMSKVNKNVLSLAKVVGASAGVPGVFPPTMIAGDVLVDGGVADNQGIESIIDDAAGCDLLLVSDASGQMEEQDTISSGALTVVARVNSVLQFQGRNKLIDILYGWERLSRGSGGHNSFAFIHLYRDLKDDRGVTHRVSSEYITALGRIRTDLDQFSYVEREALMYHGYTLIDAQMRKHCAPELSVYLDANPAGTMRTPPLFRGNVQNQSEFRDQIRRELEAGSENLYLLRCAKKYPKVVVPILVAGGLAALTLLWLVLLWSDALVLNSVRGFVSTLIQNVIPRQVSSLLDAILLRFGQLGWNTTLTGLSGIAALLILVALALYLVSFPIYLLVRFIASTMDERAYKALAGKGPNTCWEDGSPPDQSGTAK